MKRLTWFYLTALLATAALTADDKKAAPAPAAVTVPAGATEVSPGVWRLTEKNGKSSLYRQTPFGLSKIDEAPASASPMLSTPGKPAAAPTADSKVPEVEVKIQDLGETVRFERPSPMGPRVWERRKSELSQQEKDWLAAKTKSAANLKPQAVEK